MRDRDVLPPGEVIAGHRRDLHRDRWLPDGQDLRDGMGDRGHEIVHEPKLFPEYNPHFYATFFLDMHGFMLEAVTYEKVEDADA